MESSDDEFEALSQSVSDFHFEDENGEPIAFYVLPLVWGEDELEQPNGERREIFLRGVVDDGLLKIYKPVTAWKFSLSEAVPWISVVFKENKWIKLQKPRKGYEDEIKSILITIHSLHFVKKNPEAAEKSLWDHLAKNFSSYEDRPSQDDLVDHISLISEAVKRVETLGKSKFLISFLKEKPQKRKEFDKVAQTSAKPAFIVDEDEVDDDDDVSDEEDDLFGYVCAICDNGGDLLCCDGQCMRSFHATKEAGSDTECESLGFTTAQVKAMQSFICKNCQYNQHQCFCCQKLGSSDKASGAAEVFRCVNATCGLFYHPSCVAKVLHREDEAAAEEMRERIASGESFTCPIHRCCVCKKLEDKNVPELQFALCRRCPKSYHRKCLPSKIAFEDKDDEDIIQRAWENLIPKRILIYCLKHEIDEELGTPIRDHIKFPAVGKNVNKQVAKSLSGKEKIRTKRSLALEDTALERTAKKPSYQVKRSLSVPKKVDLVKRNEEKWLPNSANKKIDDAFTKPFNGNTKSVCKKVEKDSTGDENRTSLGDQLFDMWSTGSEPGKTRRLDSPVASDKTTIVEPNEQLDADSERRVLKLMEESSSSITLEGVMKKHKVPSTHFSRNNVDKTITQGKIEGSVEAIRAALQKLEKGGSIEDAKAVCEPEILHQIARWKNKLKVYLAPFLHGMRYTSFGRHFTNVEKLKEIVDKLHWYVKNGDMVVDFCCGANDFSCLMKTKLEETNKKCFYKNYDILQAKNDFSFEKRDWMTVKMKELPTGSQLIMGLNPPFGVKASLANQFINKALEFKPKLLILIVPRETERLDKKRSPYDLVWQDGEKLSGKSFYLPGSVDVNDKQMEQWNLTPPVLYLWSRPDWTNKHRAIAREHGHLPSVKKKSQSEGIKQEHVPLEDKHIPFEETHSPPADICCHHDVMSTVTDDHPVGIDDPIPSDSKAVSTVQNERSPGAIGGEPHRNHDHPEKQNQPNEKSRTWRRDRKNYPSGGKPMGSEMRRGRNHLSPPSGTGGRRSLGGHQSESHKVPSHVGYVEEGSWHSHRGMHGSGPQFRRGYGGSPSSPGVTDPRSTMGGLTYESHEMPSHAGFGVEGYSHFQQGMSAAGPQFGRGYGGNGVGIPDDPARQYSLNSREPYSSGAPAWPTDRATDGHDYRPYAGEKEDILSQVRRFGRQDERHSYPEFDPLTPVSSYGHHLGSPGEPPLNRLNTSAMERYAPRLNELNHTVMNTSGPAAPMGGGNGGMYDLLAPRSRLGPDSMGFAQGRQHPFSYNGRSI